MGTLCFHWWHANNPRLEPWGTLRRISEENHGKPELCNYKPPTCFELTEKNNEKWTLLTTATDFRLNIQMNKVRLLVENRMTP